MAAEEDIAGTAKGGEKPSKHSYDMIRLILSDDLGHGDSGGQNLRSPRINLCSLDSSSSKRGVMMGDTRS